MDEEEIERNAKCKVEGARFLGGPRNDRGAEGARFLVVGLARNDRRKGVGMENLHEIGFVVREKRRRIRNRALLAVVLTVLLGGLMLAGARIDGLERELAREQARFLHSSDSVGMTGRTDTVMIGLKRATLQDGDVVLRIGIVGEEAEVKAEAEGGKR